MGYYPTILKNKISPLVIRWIKLDNIMPNEISQKGKEDIYFCSLLESKKIANKQTNKNTDSQQ